MTGVLQTHSRKHKVAIDQLNFSFKVLDLDYDAINDSPKVLISTLLINLIGRSIYLWTVYGWCKMGER